MDKYLGDLFHSDGLSASVDATVSARTGKTKGAIMEVAAVIEDMRMQVIGGMMGAWDLWNHAIVPSLLSNCGTWMEISDTTVNKLEELQNLMVRRMLCVPESTSVVALRAEAGLLSMKHRIWLENVALAMAIRKMPESHLSKQVMEEQMMRGWPGLAKEVMDICEEIEIPNVLAQNIPKCKVKQAIYNHHNNEIKYEMKDKKKLKNICQENFKEPKSYMKSKCLEDSRVMFRIRTNMVLLKENMKQSHKGNLICPGCMKPGTQENQTHVMVCEAYESLRAGLKMENDIDLVTYFQRIMRVREVILRKRK